MLHSISSNNLHVTPSKFIESKITRQVFGVRHQPPPTFHHSFLQMLLQKEFNHHHLTPTMEFTLKLKCHEHALFLLPQIHGCVNHTTSEAVWEWVLQIVPSMLTKLRDMRTHAEVVEIAMDLKSSNLRARCFHDFKLKRARKLAATTSTSIPRFLEVFETGGGVCERFASC